MRFITQLITLACMGVAFLAWSANHPTEAQLAMLAAIVFAVFSVAPYDPNR